MRVRFAVFTSLLASSLLVSITAFPQEPERDSHHQHAPTSAERQNSAQQRSPAAPRVFFPMADQPEMEMHHHGEIPEVMPQFPCLGDSQRVAPGPVYQLEDLERMAKEHNPTLAQAQRAVEAARGHERQSGLYPNPSVGYEGEEIRGGVYGGGEQGFFVEQPIILGGKLGLNRKVSAGEVKQRQAEAEAQRRRVENDVRMAYYRVLAAQERLGIGGDLVNIAQSTVRIVRQLYNVGQVDETEVLESEAEEQRMEIAAGVAQHMLQRQWIMLISVVGVPTLPEGSVAGRIDADLPSLDERQLLTSLLAVSPAVQSAQAGVERAEATLRRAQREPIPDLTFKGGLQQNYEPLDAAGGRQVGLQGFAEIGLHLRLWDRNQGAIAAGRADLEAARNEVSRVELMLRKRSAIYTEDYRSARLTADRYRVEILPRLERAYRLMTTQYGEMTASFIRVLNLQRMVYENETGYIDALEHIWTDSIALSGFLLEGGLMVPASMEMDLPASGTERMRSMDRDSKVFDKPSNLVPLQGFAY
ncbi:MAG TPA: TolC family protein [Terriglobales bacterium]|nr:TolC family protein [Terriglobales bacterium]